MIYIRKSKQSLEISNILATAVLSICLRDIEKNQESFLHKLHFHLETVTAYLT